MLSEIDEGDPLLAGVAAKIAEGHLAVGDLVLADDGGERGTGTVGDFHLGLHRAATVGTVGADAGVPERGAHPEGVAAAGHVDDEDLHRRLRGGEDTFGVASEEDAVDAQGEADARGGGTTEILDQAVVPAAAANGVLGGGEGIGGELERGSGVVVEAAHKAR